MDGAGTGLPGGELLPVRRGWAWGVLVLAASILVAATWPAAASTGREDHMRTELAQLVNGERANRGLAQLPVDLGLSQRAQAWAERQRSTGCEPPTDCHSVDAEAEVLAWGGVDTRTGGLVVAWMQSTDHRNLLLHGKATALGVGFACSESGAVYAVIQFAGIRKPVAPTGQDPIASSPAKGSACTGPPAYLSDTAPPTTTATTSPPTAPTTRPTSATTAAPRRVPPPTTPVAPSTTVPGVVLAPAATVDQSVVPATTTTTAASRFALSAAGDPAEIEAALDAELLSDATPGGGRTESAWIGMVVVVVLLSGLRVAFQLRDHRHTSLRDQR